MLAPGHRSADPPVLHDPWSPEVRDLARRENWPEHAMAITTLDQMAEWIKDRPAAIEAAARMQEDDRKNFASRRRKADLQELREIAEILLAICFRPLLELRRWQHARRLRLRVSAIASERLRAHRAASPSPPQVPCASLTFPADADQ